MPKYTFKSLLSKDTVSAEQLETERQFLNFDRTIAHLNRRGFLAAFAGTATMVALAGKTAYGQSTAVSVVDVLNFALNLEYLEANFYLSVSAGTNLIASNASLAGTGAVAVMGLPGKLTLDANTQAVAAALAIDEVNHIATLRAAISALGGTPIAQPLINLAAKGAITTQPLFLMAARQFTALGGSAYAGSAQFLVSNPAVLTNAAQILGAEGQHAGVLNNLCVAQGVISPAIDAQDIPPTAAQMITVDPLHALSPARLPNQVLGVAFGASTATTTTPPAGVTVGGFFPSGVNGTSAALKTT